MPETHAARRARAQAKVAALDADAVLVTSAPNVRYLTGLASSNAALLLPSDGRGVLATDFRYELAAQRDCPDLDLVIGRFIEQLLTGEITRRGLRMVAFEAHEMTVERHRDVAASAEGVTLVPFGHGVEDLRMVKDATELELLATACRITAQAFADVLPRIRPGLSERALAGELDHRMAELGAERPAFDTIVASGPNGAIPHHAPAGRPLRRGDLITMDFGACYAGYHADMTRTVALGERRLAARDLRAGRGGPAGGLRGGAAGGGPARRGRGRPGPYFRGRARRAFPARARPRSRAGSPRGTADRIRKYG